MGGLHAPLHPAPFGAVMFQHRLDEMAGFPGDHLDFSPGKALHGERLNGIAHPAGRLPGLPADLHDAADEGCRLGTRIHIRFIGESEWVLRFILGRDAGR